MSPNISPLSQYFTQYFTHASRVISSCVPVISPMTGHFDNRCICLRAPYHATTQEILSQASQHFQMPKPQPSRPRQKRQRVSMRRWLNRATSTVSLTSCRSCSSPPTASLTCLFRCCAFWGEREGDRGGGGRLFASKLHSYLHAPHPLWCVAPLVRTI